VLEGILEGIEVLRGILEGIEVLKGIIDEVIDELLEEIIIVINVELMDVHLGKEFLERIVEEDRQIVTK
tara:strand:- start:2128 stop:2334 length:207 start_codon:yes stop_codon:yes gene_type:complete